MDPKQNCHTKQLSYYPVSYYSIGTVFIVVANGHCWESEMKPGFLCLATSARFTQNLVELLIGGILILQIC